MNFAYADPPYYGNGARLYGEYHPDAAAWDTKDAHFDLIRRLIDEYPDGWALSCNPSDLQWLLTVVPDSVRICSWAKSFHRIRPLVNVQYSWEPLLLSEGRVVRNRRPFVRDHLVCPIAMKKGLPGAKPDKFCDWVLDLLGFDPGQDTLTDIFPGTGGMQNAVYRRSNALPFGNVS